MPAKPSAPRTLLWILLALLGLRIATLGLYTLHDTTEARYANIARVMLETGNWISPQNAPGDPFWAKPPLYVWSAAASMAVCGVNEFGARLPSVLFVLAACLIVAAWARGSARTRGAPPDEIRLTGPVAALVFGTSAVTFVSAGSIMTEASLVLATVWMSAAFWFAVARPPTGKPVSALWRWGFFAAAGLGMLAKGPVALVYSGLPALVWTCWRGGWRRLWARLPWVRGTLLSAALCVPWYLAAEHRTPGFLEYFILGEHFGRFLVPHWQGDKYGGAHANPIGMIWIFWLAGALPWSFVALSRSWRWLRMRRAGTSTRLDDSGAYILLTAVMPMLFFTPARNTIWPYPLPALPGLAVLLVPALLAAPGQAAIAGLRRWAFGTFAGMIAAYAIVFAGIAPWLNGNHCAGPIIAEYRLASAIANGPLYFVAPTVPASGLFYSQGTARCVWPPARVAELPVGPLYLVSRNSLRLDAAPAPLAPAVTEIARRGDYRLYLRH
jgi:4-amino-4-deoxy-L-arabinose transferase-like glycosyltransferase